MVEVIYRACQRREMEKTINGRMELEGGRLSRSSSAMSYQQLTAFAASKMYCTLYLIQGVRHASGSLQILRIKLGLQIKSYEHSLLTNLQPYACYHIIDIDMRLNWNIKINIVSTLVSYLHAKHIYLFYLLLYISGPVPSLKTGNNTDKNKKVISSNPVVAAMKESHIFVADALQDVLGPRMTGDVSSRVF